MPLKIGVVYCPPFTFAALRALPGGLLLLGHWPQDDLAVGALLVLFALVQLVRGDRRPPG